MSGTRAPRGRLIGREAEIATIGALLRDHARLITITGPPGVGKTRLATEAATTLAADYRDGSVVIDLSTAHDGVGAWAAITRGLGLHATPVERSAHLVPDALLDRDGVIVLDNAEQVIGLATDVDLLLDQCPDVRLLVTSRERLHLSVEHELSVPPLAMPQPDEIADLARLTTNPSVAVFIAAARAVQPDFAITVDNAASVADICVRLDGLPLALELAAARVKLFGPADIAARLKDRRAILEATAYDVPARHRTLWSAISWSHAVLSEPERRLFRRLSIFAGTFTVDAVEAVSETGDLAPAVAVLASLLDKSLVQSVAGADGQNSFVLLESLRDYAAEQLDAHRERPEVAAAHARYCVEIALEAEAYLGTADELFWWDHVGLQEGNLRAALEWSVEAGDIDSALALTTAVGWYRYTRGHIGAGQETVDAVLRSAAETHPSPDSARLSATLTIGAILAWARGDLDRADDLLAAVLAETATRRDQRREAIALAFRGHVARDRGDFEAARAFHQESGRLFDLVDNARGAAWARFDLGRVAWQAGALAEAASLLRDSLRRFRDLGYIWAVAWASWALGRVLVAQDAVAEGSALMAGGLDDFDSVSDRRGVALCLEGLALTAVAGERFVEGTQLLAAATAIRRRLAAPLTEVEAAIVDEARQAATDALGDYVSDLEWQAGLSLSADARRRLARQVAGVDGAEESGETAATDEPEVSLTRRERQVAALVAAGCTNQQVGRRLGITARTAEAHVHNIMGKLSARSRSEVAVWAATHGLHQSR